MAKRFTLRIIFLLVSKSRVLFYRLLSTHKIAGQCHFIQATQVLGPGQIMVGDNVKLGYFPSPHFFNTYCYLEARSPHASIKIGENTHINNGFVAIAEQSSISIGKNCLIGTRVEIYDSDFHALSAIERANGVKHISKEVRIGNEVFIGSNVKILKGASIGDGAVIANGSVVTKHIPPYVIASGVPANTIRIISDGN